MSLETSCHASIYELYCWLYHGERSFLQRKYSKFVEFENLYMSRLAEMQEQ